MPENDLDLSIGAPQRPQVASAGDVDGDLVDDVAGVDYFDDDAPEVHSDTVRNVLVALGAGLGYVAGDEDVPDAWRFKPSELDALVPPLTSVINRTPKLRAAVARGDYAVIGIHLAAYGGRNLGDLRRARRNRTGDLDAEGGDDLESRLPAPGGAGGQSGWGHGGGVRDGEPGS